MTKYINSIPKFLVATLLVTASAYGQNFPVPPGVPHDELRTGTFVEREPQSVLTEAISPRVTESGPYMPDELLHGDYGGNSVLSDQACGVWGDKPVLTESTGTWLRRGWWFTEIDAVVLQRQWKRDDVTLSFDTSSGRRLHINRADPGASGSVRLTLGRFLFRDDENRDHTMEFTVFGGGEWSQNDTITSNSGGNTLSVPPGVGKFNLGFNQANSMAVEYSSRFNSFEMNYRVKGRMGRDRMELGANGQWVRRANNGITKQFLVGLRYFDLADIADWTATDIATQGGEDGRYFVKTNNDLFGSQVGGSIMIERDRWNLEFGGKGGLFINDVKSNSNLAITNNAANSYIVANRETALSFVGEFQMLGRYHLRPNLSLRAGYQVMYVSAVALAPDQFNFSPDAGRFPYTGDPFYYGAIFGFEGYW